MDRAVLQDHLAAAERHITAAECVIASQREHLAQLLRDGYVISGHRSKCIAISTAPRASRPQ